MKHLDTLSTARAIGYALKPDTVASLRRAAVTLLTDLIVKHRGNLSAVAREMGVARYVVGKWCKAEPRLVDVANREKETAGLRRDNWAGPTS